MEHLVSKIARVTEAEPNRVSITIFRNRLQDGH